MSGNGLPTRQERKQQLIAVSGTYRTGISEGRRQVQASLQADSLFKKAASHLALTAVAVFKGRNKFSVRGLQALLPLAISGISLLRNKSAHNPVIRKLALAAAVGAVVTVLAKRKFSTSRPAGQESAPK